MFPWESFSLEYFKVRFAEKLEVCYVRKGEWPFQAVGKKNLEVLNGASFL